MRGHIRDHRIELADGLHERGDFRPCIIGFMRGERAAHTRQHPILILFAHIHVTKFGKAQKRLCNFWHQRIAT